MAPGAKAVLSPNAPAPIGPYSQAIRAGSFLFCSGQVALDPQTGDLVGADAATQVPQVMKNIAAVLAAGGATLADVVKTTIFLVDMADFVAVNRVYGESFPDGPPARSTVAVAGLPRNARVEIEVVAYLG
jgi:2-iminobutanoate/2-iminopropanoate deaminase